MIALHHAHAGKRFRQPPGDLRIQLGARAKDRPDHLNGPVESKRAAQQHRERHAGHECADAQQHDQRKQRGHDAAGEFHQARADQIAQTLDVVHHPRHQRAGLGRIVISDGQSSDVGLHLLAQRRNHPVRRFGKPLRERERSDTLHDGRAKYRHGQWPKKLYLPLDQHVVHQKFQGRRQHQTGQPIDGHQPKSGQEQPALWTDERPYLHQQTEEAPVAR